MAEGYDGFNVAMGLMADTFDEDEAKRKEGRAEQTAIRKEGRVDQRLKEFESRADSRLIQQETRTNTRTDSVRDEQRQWDKLENAGTKRMELVEDAAKLGIPYKGKSDDQIRRALAVHAANAPAVSWFILNKEYIDRLTEKNPEAMYELGITGPLNIESLNQMPDLELKTLMARLEGPVKTSRTTSSNERIRKDPAYQKALAKHKQRMQTLARLAMPLLGNGIVINTPEAKAAHLEVAALMRNNPDFVKLMGGENELGEARMDLWAQNPTAFLKNVFNRSKGLKYLTQPQSVELAGMWLKAKEDALLTLEERVNNSSTSINDRNKSRAALNFLQKELDYGDMRSQREQLVKLIPIWIEQTKGFLQHPLWGGPATEEGAIMLDFMSNQEPVTRQGTGGPPLPGSTPAPGQTPAALGGKPTLPPPKTAPSAGQSVVEIKGGAARSLMQKLEGGSSPLEMAEKLLGETWFTGRFARGGVGDALGLGDNSPLGRVQQAITYLEQKQRDARANLVNMGASRNAKGIILTDTKTLDNVYEAGGGTTTFNKTGEELMAEQKEAPGLFQKLDEIGVQLSTLKAAAERATGAKIPSLGSGSRQQ